MDVEVALEVAPIPAWIQGVETIHVANQPAADFFGVSSPAALAEDSALSYVPADERDRARRRNVHVLEAEESVAAMGGRIYDADGTVKHGRFAAGPVEYEGSAAIFVLAQDVTTRKQYERRLERLTTRLRLALQGTGTGVWEWNLDTDEVVWDEQVEDLFGYETGEFPGTYSGFVNRVHPDDVERVESALEAGIDDGFYEAEFRVHVDGETRRWVLARAEVRYEDGTPERMVGIVTDVTDRKQRERELRRKNARLDEFASLISHDLRNPLTEAKGRLELVEEECESDHVPPIAAALDRMETIVDDTLTLARQGDTVGETERIPIAPLVQECWRVVDSADATIEIDDEFAVRGDPDRIRHVFENLFRNAIEHGGDDVTVRVGRSGPDEMYVEDDGPGIPADERTTAFDPGHTSLDAGSGLGLTIVERIVEAHDWTIHATEGRGGARFEIGGVDVE